MKRLANIFSVCANFMDEHAGDLFIDFPSALHELQALGKVTLFVNKSNADLMSRYRAVLIEKGNNHPTEGECIELCNRTLGLGFVVRILPNKVVLSNVGLSQQDILRVASQFKSFTPVELK